MSDEQVVKLLQDIRDENAAYHQKSLALQEETVANQSKVIKSTTRVQRVWYVFVSLISLILALVVAWFVSAMFGFGSST